MAIAVDAQLLGGVASQSSTYNYGATSGRFPVVIISELQVLRFRLPKPTS